MKLSCLHQWIRLKKVILRVVGGFILGFFIGYFLGLARLHDTVTKNFIWKYLQQLYSQISSRLIDSAWMNLALNWFATFSPSLGFLSDVIAYQAAVVAIAIPVSLEIISRISERYQSGVITQEFSKQWQLQILFPLVLIDALVAVTLKFFIPSDPIAGFWKFLAWLVFLAFIITNVILVFFFNTLQQYTTDTKFLLDHLFNEITSTLEFITAKRCISDLRLNQSQAQLIDALEGIGDILVFEIRSRKSNKPIINSLRQLEEKVQKFFEIQQTHPERYQRLSLSQEFFQLQENNPKAAEFNLAIIPEEYHIFLTTAINQLLRSRDSALEVKNVDIARFATYHLIWLLRYLSQKLDNSLLIRTILQNLAELRSTTNVNQGDSAYTLSISWYIDTIFEDDFRLVYLGLFDLYFIPAIRQIITSANNTLFQALVKTLIESGKLQRHTIYLEAFERFQRRFGFQNYGEVNHISQIRHQIEGLSSLFNQIRTAKQLEECQSLISSIGNIVLPSLSQSQKEEAAQEIEALKTESNFVFKFNHLVDLVFDLGAYCLFKQRFEEIHYLWNYKQPLDSDAQWLGHEITPHTLGGLVNFYFSPSLFERGLPVYWEDHHGSQRYYDLYFLLLLLREFQSVRVSSNEARKNLINNFQLPAALDSSRLSAIAHDVDTLVPLARELNGMTEMLQQLGFQREQIGDAINHGLIPFLESLKPSVQRELEQIIWRQPISQNKVETFKTDFLIGYNQGAILRFLFQHYNLYEARLNDLGDKNIPKIGFDIALEKPTFFENWYADYGNPGRDYGRSFAGSEDTRLISKIVPHCSQIESTTIESILEKIESILEKFGDSSLEHLIIVGVNSSIPFFFINSKQFHSKWEEGGLKLEVTGFIGSYTYVERKIPIFQTFVNKFNDNSIPEKFILILNRTKLGCLKQYSPLGNNEQEQLYEHFTINIQAFVEYPNLMDTLLQNPPSWLLKSGDIARQRASLEVKVLVQVYEKFSLNVADDFQGYLIAEAEKLYQ